MPPGVQSAATGLRAEALLQILEVTRKLAAPFDLPAVLAEIGEAARSVLQAERATVWLYEAEQGALALARSGLVLDDDLAGDVLRRCCSADGGKARERYERREREGESAAQRVSKRHLESSGG